jgi:hypothetical protein
MAKLSSRSVRGSQSARPVHGWFGQLSVHAHWVVQAAKPQENGAEPSSPCRSGRTSSPSGVAQTRTTRSVAKSISMLSVGTRARHGEAGIGEESRERRDLRKFWPPSGVTRRPFPQVPRTLRVSCSGDSLQRSRWDHRRPPPSEARDVTHLRPCAMCFNPNICEPYPLLPWGNVASM